MQDIKYSNLNEIFDAIRLRLEKLNKHERVGILDLADDLVKMLPSVPVSYLPQMIRLYVKGSSGKYTIEIGRDGGVYAGGRPPKEEKPRCEVCNQVLRPVVSKTAAIDPFENPENIESVLETTGEKT